MTTSQPSVIIEELKSLIIYSCNEGQQTGSSFLSLHKGLVKVYFEARNVEIDYETQKVKADLPITPTQYTKVSFDCQNLERFLKSCIKNDKKSLLYYQNVLAYYSYLKVAWAKVTRIPPELIEEDASATSSFSHYSYTTWQLAKNINWSIA